MRARPYRPGGACPEGRCSGRPGEKGALGRTLPQDPACSPRLGDHLVMVNGVSMENVSSSFAIQILKTCTKLANVVSGGLVGGPRPRWAPPGPAAHRRPKCMLRQARGILSPPHSFHVEAQRGARVPQGCPVGGAWP